MIKIAHRGYSSEFNDNNIISFQKAIEHHFDYIETDIQLNKDNSLVIYHDISYNNTLINQMNDEEIKQNNILFLKDLFDKIDLNKHKNLKILLDLKISEGLSKILYDFLIKNKINLNQIIIASFNTDHLDYYIDHSLGDLNLGYISANNNVQYKHLDKIKYIILDISTINHELINNLKKKNKIIFCYTCYFKCELSLFRDYNIDGIITNIKLD